MSRQIKNKRLKMIQLQQGKCPFYMSLLVVLIVQLIALKNLEKAQAYNQLYTEAKQIFAERSVKPVAKTDVEP